MNSSRQTRREFCTHACRALSLAAAGGALGSVLQGCAAGGAGGPASPSSLETLPVVAASDASGAVVVTIDSGSPLSAVGGAALVQSPTALVLVAHVGADTFNAFDPTCTHQACTVDGFSGQTFVCPCHGSQFSTSGQVVSGPAPLPLRQYRTRFAGGVLTITA